MRKNRWKTKELQHSHNGYHASRWTREDCPSNTKLCCLEGNTTNTGEDLAIQHTNTDLLGKPNTLQLSLTFKSPLWCSTLCAALRATQFFPGTPSFCSTSTLPTRSHEAMVTHSLDTVRAGLPKCSSGERLWHTPELHLARWFASSTWNTHESKNLSDTMEQRLTIFAGLWWHEERLSSLTVSYTTYIQPAAAPSSAIASTRRTADGWEALHDQGTSPLKSIAMKEYATGISRSQRLRAK